MPTPVGGHQKHQRLGQAVPKQVRGAGAHGPHDRDLLSALNGQHGEEGADDQGGDRVEERPRSFCKVEVSAVYPGDAA